MTKNKRKKPQTAKQHYAKIKRLKKQADKLFQQVGLKLGIHCQSCGKRAEVCHHAITKSLSNALRYDLKNSISLCVACHFKHHTQEDLAIYEAFTSNKDANWYKYIKENRDKPTRFTLTYLQTTIDALQKELNK